MVCTVFHVIMQQFNVGRYVLNMKAYFPYVGTTNNKVVLAILMYSVDLIFWFTSNAKAEEVPKQV